MSWRFPKDPLAAQDVLLRVPCSLSSTTRREDHPGLLLDSWSTDEIEELAPLHTTLEWSGHEGAVIPVHLEADVNELGILELRCVSRDGQRWKLEFNVRD